MPDDVVTEVELGDLRGALQSWMVDTCTIYGHSAPVDDDYGGTTTNPETVKQAGVPCYIESGAEHVQQRALLAKIADTHAFSVTVPAETDIEVDDHVVVTSRENLHLRIVAVMEPETWEMERRALGTVLGEHHE